MIGRIDRLPSRRFAGFFDAEHGVLQPDPFDLRRTKFAVGGSPSA